MVLFSLLLDCIDATYAWMNVAGIGLRGMHPARYSVENRLVFCV